MDTCTNCGATLRPGAKFCTTCGTRLNETRTPNQGWDTPRSNDESDATSVMEAIQPEQDTPASSSSISDSRERSWSSAYATSESASLDDPASRFISALEDDVKDVDEEEKPATTDPDSTWGSPVPTFTPPPPSSWSYSGSDDTKQESNDSSWEVPSTWSGVDAAEEPDEPEIAEPAIEEEQATEAEFAEVMDADTATDEQPDLSPEDARSKAIELADELRRTIRMMSSGGESDHGAAVMALTEASLFVGDFSDVRGVIADVKNDPRDIQALGALSAKVDRLEDLLNEHRSLADAIETAIQELNG